MSYPENAALGVADAIRKSVVPDEDDPDVPELMKTEDIEVDELPEGDVEKAMREEFGIDITNAQEVAKSLLAPGEVQPDDSELSYEESVAISKHDVDTVHPDRVALSRLQKRLASGEEIDEGEVSESPVEDAITSAVEKFEKNRINKQEVFQDALVHATSMAESKSEAAALASEFVLKATDDTELAVEARAKAMEGVEKARQYVESASDAPDDVQVKEGEHGALYWNPEDRGAHGTQPTENDLLEMDREELGKLSQVDMNDPDTFIGGPVGEVEKSETERIAEALSKELDVSQERAEKFVEESVEKGVDDPEEIARNAEVVFSGN